MNVKRIPVITAGGGILIVGLFIILEIIRLPGDKELLKRTPLTPGTAEWHRWLRRTTFYSVYLFNTTNPNQVALGVKPKLVEVGPYVYQVIETKTKVQYDESTATVSYAVSKAIQFMPAQSIGSEEDEFTIPNVPLIVLERWKSGNSTFVARLAEEAVRNNSDEKLFLTWTVAEMAHRGKQSAVHRAFIDSMPWLSELMNGDYYLDILEIQNIANGTSEVKTGNAHSLEEIGKLLRDGESGVSEFDQRTCGELRGTDGTIFPPDISKDKNYFVYFPGYYRSLYFQYVHVKATTTADAIRSFRFELPQQQLEYPGKSNENSCYCKTSDHSSYFSDHREEKVKCPYNGTIAVNTGGDSGFVISLPHFLHGVSELQTMAEGMHPDPQRHLSYLELEPESGFILSSHVKTQLNLDLRNTSLVNISHLSNISEAVYPISWLDHHITDLNDPSLKRALLPGGDSVGDAVLGSSKWILCIVGIVMVLGSTLWILYATYCEAVKEGQNGVVLLRPRFSAAEFRACSPATLNYSRNQMV